MILNNFKISNIIFKNIQIQTVFVEKGNFSSIASFHNYPSSSLNKLLSKVIKMNSKLSISKIL